jgi:hypothetical protein
MWLWGEPISHGATIERWLTEQLAIRSYSSPSDAEIFVQTVQGLAYAPISIQKRTLSANRRVVSRVCWSLVASGILGLLIPRRSISTPSSQSST